MILSGLLMNFVLHVGMWGLPKSAVKSLLSFIYRIMQESSYILNPRNHISVFVSRLHVRVVLLGFETELSLQENACCIQQGQIICYFKPLPPPLTPQQRISNISSDKQLSQSEAAAGASAPSISREHRRFSKPACVWQHGEHGGKHKVITLPDQPLALEMKQNTFGKVLFPAKLLPTEVGPVGTGSPAPNYHLYCFKKCLCGMSHC